MPSVPWTVLLSSGEEGIFQCAVLCYVLLHIASLCHVCYSVVVCCILPCRIMMQCVCVTLWYVLFRCGVLCCMVVCATALLSRCFILQCVVLYCVIHILYCVIHALCCACWCLAVVSRSPDVHLQAVGFLWSLHRCPAAAVCGDQHLPQAGYVSQCLCLSVCACMCVCMHVVHACVRACM